jgi:hypothetical protein
VLKRFLLCVSTAGGVAQEGLFDSYILEAPLLTGPFRLVQYLPKFGEQVRKFSVQRTN